MDYISTTPLYDSNYLAHHGIKGQKWGVRRFQNPDGTLTAAGQKRYYGQIQNAENKNRKYMIKNGYSKAHQNVESVKKKIFDDELSKSKEYLQYKKALNETEDAEDKMYSSAFYNGTQSKAFEAAAKKYGDAKSREEKSLEKYDAIIGKTYLNHQKELYEAKMKDLKLPSSYVNYYKDYKSGGKVNYDPEILIRLL